MGGHEFGGLERNPSEVFVDLLESAQDELLGLLVILGFKVGQHLPDDIEIDLAIGGSVGFRVWHDAFLPAFREHGR
jgi:hypothetical protein